jgi:hypothetical protein
MGEHDRMRQCRALLHDEAKWERRANFRLTAAQWRASLTGELADAAQAIGEREMRALMALVFGEERANV